MRMEWYQRKLAVFLSVILMLEPVVQVLPAMAYGKTVMEIAEFEELDESVMVQTVPYGTAYEDLDLPDYLSAHVFEVTVEDEEEDEEVASGSDATSSDASSSAATPANASSSAATVSDASGEGTSGGDDGYRMIPVTWELSSGPGGLSDYDGETAGTYVFDAVLAAGGYRLGDAILPFIEVEVLEAEPLAVTALLTTNGELIDISDATVVIDGTYTYDGSEQVPSKDNIRVILNGEEIHLSDYSIASPNVNAGTAIVSVNVMNDDTYTGTAYGYFEIQPAGLTVSGVTFENTKREYDGTNEVKVSGVTLSGVIGNDDVSVDERGLTGTVDSANVGTYTSVTLSGLSLTGADAGNYTVPEQTVNANVTISPKTLTGELGISVSPNTYEYDKTEKEPNVRVLIDGVQISESEYTVSYENNVNTGTATATATLTGNYSGSVTGDFTIHPKELTVTGATVSDRVYDGTKVVTVTGVTLDGVLGTDVVSVDVSGISGELDSADAGTYSSVQLAGSWSLDGKDAGNYTVTEPTSAVSTTVTISPKTVSSPTITLSETTYEYDGTEKKPDVTVMDGTTEIQAREYTVSYADNVDAGTAKVTIADVTDGNYTIAETSQTFTITSASLQGATVAVEGTYTYNGAEQRPSAEKVTVTLNGKTIPSSMYNVSFSNNINAGIATVDVTGLDTGYKEGASGSFTIEPKELTVTDATVSDRAYDGTNVVEVSEVTLDGVISGDAADVDMSESNLTGAVESVNAGTYTSLSLDGTLSLKGGSEDNYTVTLPVTVNLSSPVTIAAKELTVSGAEASDRAYDGTNVVTVTGVTLDGVVYGDDVLAGVHGLTGTVDGADAGTYTSVTLPQDLSQTLVLYGGDEDNYTLTQPTTAVGTNVTILPKTVSSPTITLSQTTYEYDGTEKKPDVTVMDGTMEIPASEYTVNYADNVDAGTAKVTIADVTGRNYTVSGSTTFAITALSLDDAVVTVAGSYTYNGTEQTPSASDITVSLEGNTVAASNYTVSVSNNTNAGTATVTVTGTGNYSGSATGGFTIEPKPVGILSISLSETTYEYDGRAKEPTAIVVDTYGEVIPPDEYAVSYANNVEAGTAIVVIIDADGGNYKVYESSTTFAITALSLDDAVVTVAGSYTYDGTEQTPSASDITVSLNGNTISSANYTISVSDNTSAGTATVVVTGTGSYSGSATGSFMIAAKTVSSPTITLSETTYEYDGTEKKPDVTVTDGTTEIPSGEYTVSYADNVDTGTATVIITDVAGGNYTVNGTADFTIQAKATEEETDSDERESSVQFSDNGRWMSGARGWWYSDHNGDYPKGEWRQLSWLGKTNWYYFDAEGWMVTGWLDWNGKRYHLHTISDGTLGYMYTGWEQIDGVWYYFDESGALLINGMAPDGHRTDENGASVE